MKDSLSQKFTSRKGNQNEGMGTEIIPIPIAAALIGASATLSSTGARMVFDHIRSSKEARPSGIVIENVVSNKDIILEKIFKVGWGGHSEVNDSPFIKALPSSNDVLDLLKITDPNISKIVDNKDMASVDFVIDTLVKEFEFNNYVSHSITDGQSVLVYRIEIDSNDSCGIAFIYGFTQNNREAMQSKVYIDKWSAVENLINQSDECGNKFRDLADNEKVKTSNGENVTIQSSEFDIQISFTAGQLTKFLIQDYI